MALDRYQHGDLHHRSLHNPYPQTLIEILEKYGYAQKMMDWGIAESVEESGQKAMIVLGIVPMAVIFFATEALPIGPERYAAAAVDRNEHTFNVHIPLRAPSSETASSSVETAYDLPLPSPAQLALQEAELGVLISYELHTFNKGRSKDH